MENQKKTFIVSIVMLLVIVGGLVWYMSNFKGGIPREGKQLVGNQFQFAAPYGGDEWKISSRQTIQWNSSGIEDGHVLILRLNGPMSGIIGSVDGDQVREGMHTWNVRGVVRDGESVSLLPGSYSIIGEVYDADICYLPGCSISEHKQGKLISSYQSGVFTLR